MARGGGLGNLSAIASRTKPRTQTANPQIDALLETYLRTIVRDSQRLLDPDYATDMCSQASESLCEFLKRRGLDCFVATETPDAHGYQNRSKNGSGHPWHDLVVVNDQETSWSIDLTASQYGYNSLPLVRKGERPIDQVKYFDERNQFDKGLGPAPADLVWLWQW